MSFTGKAFTKDTWFEVPKQVAVARLFDEGDEDTFVGIAYHNEVICLCCGVTFGVEELEEECAVYEVLNWHNLDFQVRRLSDPFKEKENSNS